MWYALIEDNRPEQDGENMERDSRSEARGDNLFYETAEPDVHFHLC